MCLPGYHHNGFVATHAIGNMMCGYILLLTMKQGVSKTPNKKRYIS